MILSEHILDSIDRSVLCWLATCCSNHIPNVSPKEIFTAYQKEYILIANIASPNSEKNIIDNPQVCVSFIDILVQKGYQIKGSAENIGKENSEYCQLSPIINEMTGGKYPYSSIFKIKVESAKPIIAPRYILYPDTTEEDQIKSALKTYKL